MGLFSGQKSADEVRILKKKAESFESKINNLTEILSDLESEIDSLHDSSDRLHKSGGSVLSDDNEKIIVVVDGAEDEKGPVFSQESGNDEDKEPGKDIDKDADKDLDSYLNIDMSGGKEEEGTLSAGWWPSDGKFRWSGKDTKHGTITFTLPEVKSYMLDARFFVPKYIAGKHIRIVVNGNEALDFVSSGGLTAEKKVKIPAKFLKKGSNSIIFKAGFWCPKTVDPGHKDDSIRSLAFDFVRLDEVEETES